MCCLGPTLTSFMDRWIGWVHTIGEIYCLWIYFTSRIHILAQLKLNQVVVLIHEYSNIFYNNQWLTIENQADAPIHDCTKNHSSSILPVSAKISTMSCTVTICFVHRSMLYTIVNVISDIHVGTEKRHWLKKIWHTVLCPCIIIGFFYMPSQPQTWKHPPHSWSEIWIYDLRRTS